MSWTTPGSSEGSGGTTQDETSLAIKPTDEGSTLGSSRGDNSVDLQTIRSASNESATGNKSSILGGENNRADGDYSAVCGGIDNRAAGFYTALGGGQDNITNGPWAAVCGGRDNNCDRRESRVAGGQVDTFCANSDLFGMTGPDGIAAECMTGRVLLKAKTTDATQTSMLTDNNDKVLLLTDATQFFKITLIAREEGTDEQSVWELSDKMAYRDGSNPITIETAISNQAPTRTASGNTKSTGWRLSMSVDSSIILDFQVTGQSSTVIKWFLVYEFKQLIGT